MVRQVDAGSLLKRRWSDRYLEKMFMSEKNRVGRSSGHVMQRLMLVSVATLAVLISCAHVYEKRYSLPDETVPMITFEGYRIETRLQSRVAGYSDSEDVFYLNFVKSRTDDRNSFSIPDSLIRLEFDSVCVHLFKRDSVVCLEKTGQREMMDNIYQATRKRTQYLFSGLHLTRGNVYVWVTYVVRLVNGDTGDVLASHRVEHELKRFKYTEF